jgi:hypothetical protein
MMVDRATNAVAGAAVVSPWWLPSMTEVSHAATIALPILGCVWLLIQMLTWAIKQWRNRDG